MDVFDQAERDSAAHHARVEARAELVASARAAGLTELRTIARGLSFIAALAPYTRATDAAPGEKGRPIGPSDDELQGAAKRNREDRIARGCAARNGP